MNILKKFSYSAMFLVLLMPFVATNHAAALADTITSGQIGVRDEGFQSRTVESMVVLIFNWLIGLIALFSIIGFLVSAVLYLTSAGNEDRMKTAKSALMAAIIGVIVSLIGYFVINLVQTFLTDSTTTI